MISLCIAFLSTPLYAEDSPHLTLVLPAESIGSFASMNGLGDPKKGLINQLMEKLVEDTDIRITTVKIPTLRVIDKISHQEVDNWVSYMFDKSLIPESSNKDITISPESLNAVAIPIAGFETKLWVKSSNAKKYVHPEDFKGKTVLKIRTVTYTSYRDILKSYQLEIKDAPSLPSAIKMIMSDRADFLMMSESSIYWNYKSLGITRNQLTPITLNSSMTPFSNILLLFDKRIPILNQLLERIEIMEKNGELDTIRKALYLSPPSRPTNDK